MSDVIVTVNPANQIVVKMSELQGPQGIQGATGPSNVLSIGTVTTGSPAAASITGTSPSQVLNLTIPQGIQGVQGQQGATGATGPQGNTGATGPSGVVNVVSPITNSGSTVSAILGLDTAALQTTFSLVFPQLSAYNEFTGVNLIRSTVTTSIPLTIRGVLNQTSDLQQWQNSTPSTVASISPFGSMAVGGTGYVGRFTVYANAAGTIGAVVRGAASQSANLQEWQDSSGTVRASVGSTGVVSSGNGFRSAYFASGANTGTLVDMAQNAGSMTVVSRDNVANITLIVKGMASQTGALTQWQDSGGTLLALVNSAGTFRTSGFVTAGSTSSQFGQITAVASTASTIGLVVRAAASQTANLQEWQNDTGTVLASVGSNGNVYGARFMAVGAVGAYLQPNASTGGFLLSTNGAANKGLVIQGAASQSASLQEWQDNGGTYVAKLSPTGQFTALSTNTDYVQSSGVTNNPYFQFSGNSIFVRPRVASYIGLIIKGEASQTANLQEWQDSAGTIIGRVSASGSILSAGRITAGNASNAAGQLNVITSSASLIGVVVQAAASQTANLQEWQNSVGSILSRIRNDGHIVAASGLSVTSIYSLTAGGPRLDLGTAYTLVSTTAANVGLIVKGAASQTGDLQQWQDSSGGVLAKISSAGYFTASIVNAYTLTTGTSIYDNIFNVDDGGGSFLYTNDSTHVGLRIRGYTSQAANLQEWQNSGATILARVDSGGTVYGTQLRTLSSLATIIESDGGARLTLTKLTAAPSNPGADNARIYFRNGTNAGTLKLVVRAGAAGAETTILDNIPQ